MKTVSNIFIEPYNRYYRHNHYFHQHHSFLCSMVLVDVLSNWLSKEQPIRLIPICDLIPESNDPRSYDAIRTNAALEHKLLNEQLSVLTEEMHFLQDRAFIDQTWNKLWANGLLESVSYCFLRCLDENNRLVEHYGKAVKIKESVKENLINAIEDGNITITPTQYKDEIIKGINIESRWLIAYPKHLGITAPIAEVYNNLYSYTNLGTNINSLGEHRTSYSNLFVRACMIEYFKQKHSVYSSDIIIGTIGDVIAQLFSHALFSELYGKSISRVHTYIYIPRDIDDKSFGYYLGKERTEYILGKEWSLGYDADLMRFAITSSSTPYNTQQIGFKAYTSGELPQLKMRNALKLIQSWKVNNEMEQPVENVVEHEIIEKKLLDLKKNLDCEYSQFRLDLVTRNIASFIRHDFSRIYLQTVKPKEFEVKLIDEQTYNQATCMFKECLELIAPIMPNLYKELSNKI